MGSGCRGVSTDPIQPQHQDGFTSVIWVADKVTSGPWLCVTTGFLLSSKVPAGNAGPWVSNPFSSAEPEPQSLFWCGSWSSCASCSLHCPCSLHFSLPLPPKSHFSPLQCSHLSMPVPAETRAVLCTLQPGFLSWVGSRFSNASFYFLN